MSETDFRGAIERRITLAVSTRQLSREIAQVIINCLEYVYSFGDERAKAIRRLEQASSRWNLSKVDPLLTLKLPYDRTVYRWIDYVGSKLEKLIATLKTGACYDRGTFRSRTNRSDC